MKNIPVLLEGYKVVVTEDPTVKTYEDNGKTVVSTDYSGAQLYVVSVFVKPLPNPETGRAGKGVEVKVTLETDPGDDIREGSRVELINPRVSHWENERGSGLSWKATGLKPVTAQSAAA
nr:hypothetical protein [Kibdelosporangium sp. MJ126-NF4]